MEKIKVPDGVKLLYGASGFVIAVLIGLIHDDFDFHFDDEFFTYFLISLIICISLIFTIGKGSYRGYLFLKDWIKKTYVSSSIVIAFLMGLIIEDFDFYFDEDFFIPFFSVLIGAFFLGLIGLWIYSSYKYEKE